MLALRILIFIVSVPVIVLSVIWIAKIMSLGFPYYTKSFFFMGGKFNPTTFTFHVYDSGALRVTKWHGLMASKLESDYTVDATGDLTYKEQASEALAWIEDQVKTDTNIYERKRQIIKELKKGNSIVARLKRI